LFLPLCRGVKNNSDFNVKLNKGSEVAFPGFYSVIYDKKSEVYLTSTKRVGYLKSKLNCDGENYLNINYTDSVGESGLVGQTTSQGELLFKSPQHFYIRYRFFPPYARKPSTVFIYVHSKYPLKSVFDNGRVIQFSSKNEIDIKVSISFTSFENAFNNYQSESANKSFDSIVTDSIESWNTVLSKFLITDENVKNKTKFYTALWHSMLGRGIADDFNGDYLKFNGDIGNIPKGTHIYNTDSLWGMHWNLNQVWSLFYTDQAVSFGKYLLRIYKDVGMMPDGWLINQPVPGMPYNSSNLYLASLINKGIIFGDKKEIVAAILSRRFTSPLYGFANEGYDSFVKFGYVPLELPVYGAASSTLEYSFADNCSNNIYKKITGNNDEIFIKSQNNFKNIYSEKGKFFLARDKFGKFEQFENYRNAKHFAEGNIFQYQWYLPHRIDFLIQKLGHIEFERRLNYSLSESEKSNFSIAGTNVSGYTNLLYNHGNQVGLHTPWLFHYVNKPNLSYKFVSSILNRFYRTSKDGYGGGQDDDQGQLSGWFVLASLGLFNFNGECDSSNSYSLIPPLFSKIETRVNNNRLVIKDNRADRSSFNFKVSFNGKGVDYKIPYEDLKKGGVIEFY
jgi:predicted alpha-1,2-mannosidase